MKIKKSKKKIKKIKRGGSLCECSPCNRYPPIGEGASGKIYKSCNTGCSNVVIKESKDILSYILERDSITYLNQFKDFMIYSKEFLSTIRYCLSETNYFNKKKLWNTMDNVEISGLNINTMDYQLPKLDIISCNVFNINNKNLDFDKKYPNFNFLTIIGGGLELILWSFIHSDIKTDNIGIFRKKYFVVFDFDSGFYPNENSNFTKNNYLKILHSPDFYRGTISYFTPQFLKLKDKRDVTYSQFINAYINKDLFNLFLSMLLIKDSTLKDSLLGNNFYGLWKNIIFNNDTIIKIKELLFKYNHIFNDFDNIHLINEEQALNIKTNLEKENKDDSLKFFRLWNSLSSSLLEQENKIKQISELNINFNNFYEIIPGLNKIIDNNLLRSLYFDSEMCPLKTLSLIRNILFELNYTLDFEKEYLYQIGFLHYITFLIFDDYNFYTFSSIYDFLFLNKDFEISLNSYDNFYNSLEFNIFNSIEIILDKFFPLKLDVLFSKRRFQMTKCRDLDNLDFFEIVKILKTNLAESLNIPYKLDIEIDFEASTKSLIENKKKINNISKKEINKILNDFKNFYWIYIIVKIKNIYLYKVKFPVECSTNFLHRYLKKRDDIFIIRNLQILKSGVTN